MQASKEILFQIRVASPCTASWDEMQGNDRMRFCALCEKNVYDLSTMTQAEVETLVQLTEGKFCGRFYRRRDGAVMTADCPEGRRRLRRELILSMGILGLVFGAVTGAAASVGPHLGRVRDWALWDQEPYYRVALFLGIRT
ncbi:MAG: hypothetical protein FJX77_03165, partial [Armatimonadetes bacterium]|nr:hypothetical protein [Armatimonadota bacterium]